VIEVGESQYWSDLGGQKERDVSRGGNDIQELDFPGFAENERRSERAAGLRT
jgi:hypothetical protein